mmetsp:Transcript_9793/g.31456  ORF Transcript_9793/g.31456 Transcript_9793/m.31456 type:complete len:405 (+) Transcript_9793:107-1321(+)
MWRVVALVSLRATAGLVAPSTVGRGLRRGSVEVRSSLIEIIDDEETTAADDEASLTKVIEGSPRLGVLGFFEEGAKVDQFVLDILHAQRTWGEIVAFASDPAAAKKRFMSRSARYSGLLDVLKVEAKQESVKAMIESSEVAALVVFGAEDAAAVVRAADEAACCERVVVVTMGSEVPTIAPPSSSLEWSVVAVNASSLTEATEGGPIAIDPPEGSDGPLSRHDVYRVAAEALLLTPLTNRAVALSQGNEFATQYLKLLREYGYSRRGEVGKIANGDLITYENNTIYAEEIRNQEIAEINAEAAAQREREIQEMIIQSDREIYERQRLKIVEKAREYLGRKWQEKRFSSARGLTKADYIKVEWTAGLAEAAAILGYDIKKYKFDDMEDPFKSEEDDDEEEEEPDD